MDIFKLSAEIAADESEGEILRVLRKALDAYEADRTEAHRQGLAAMVTMWMQKMMIEGFGGLEEMMEQYEGVLGMREVFGHTQNKS